MNRRGTNPEDDFIEGEGPLAAALRELPAFEPPARMAAEFQRMLARQPAPAPAFEPPATLQATVLEAIARQQAAQSVRRDAVLGELARGADPEAALDAELAPATRAWLRERARESTGAGASDGDARGRRADVATRLDASPDGRRRRGWRFALPPGWWRFAGAGLAAVLAVGVGLRMVLEPVGHDEAAGAGAATTSDSAAASRNDALGPPTRATPSQELAKRAEERRAARQQAQARDEALTSRERPDRERALRERRGELAAVPTPPPPAAALAPGIAPAPSPAPSAPSAAAPASAPVDGLARSWRLVDDPAARLGELDPSGRWVLYCNPADVVEAGGWLGRGLDAGPSRASGHAAPASLAGRIRIEASGDVPTGEIRPARDE